jgi:hypothetical protein
MKTILAAALMATTLSVAPTSQAGTFKAGIEVSDKATADQTGIPTYPGATETMRKETRRDATEKDRDSANVNLQFGSYGLTVITTKLVTPDDAEKVAAFYKRELAKFGRVRDCNDPNERNNDDDYPRAMRCRSVDINSGAVVYRAGNKAQQRYVSIEREPRKGRTAIQLVYVEMRSPD